MRKLVIACAIITVIVCTGYFIYRHFKNDSKIITFGNIEIIISYLFENCGARRAAFKPGFFLSFALESLVTNPAFLRVFL